MHNNDSDPLQGVKLTQILSQLETAYSWDEIGVKLGINSFTKQSSTKSCLRFLRKTPWARSRIEILYLKTFCSKHPKTTKLIRSILSTQKKSRDAHSQPEEHKVEVVNNDFQWPSMKEKRKQ